MCLRMKAHKSLRCSLLCGWLLLSLHLLSYAQQTELQIYGLVSSNATTPTEAYSPRKVQQLSMRNMQRGKPLQINLVYKDDVPMKMGYKEVLEHAAKMWGDNLTVSEQTEGTLNIEVSFSDGMPEDLAYVATPFCLKVDDAIVPDALLFATGEKKNSEFPNGAVGRIQINRELNWFVEGSINESITAQQYDLKTVTLRAIGNVLGFASSVGASAPPSSKRIVQGTILDKQILDSSGLSLFEQVNGKEVGQLSAIASREFYWMGDKALPLYNPRVVSKESFMSFSDKVSGLFSWRIKKGQTAHQVDPNSLQVMWGVGWKQHHNNEVTIRVKGQSSEDILSHGSSYTFTYKTTSSLPISPITWRVEYLGKDGQYHLMSLSESQDLVTAIRFDTDDAYVNSAGLYMIRASLEGICQGAKISGEQIYYVATAPGSIKVTFTETARTAYFVDGIVRIESLGAEEFQVRVADYEDGHERKGRIEHLNYTSFRVHALRADGYTEVEVKATNKYGSREAVIPIIDESRSSNNGNRSIMLSECISDESGCLEYISVTPWKGDWSCRKTQTSYQVRQDYIYKGEIIETFLSEEEEIESGVFMYEVKLHRKLCRNEPDDIYITLYLRTEDDKVFQSLPLSIRQDLNITSLSRPTIEALGFDITLLSPSYLQITFQDVTKHQIRLHSLSGELLISEEALGSTTLTLPTTLDIAHYILQVDNKTIKL